MDAPLRISDSHVSNARQAPPYMSYVTLMCVQGSKNLTLYREGVPRRWSRGTFLARRGSTW
eukprot:1395268-Amorphochlora_amoeboformis.AAC.3